MCNSTTKDDSDSWNCGGLGKHIEDEIAVKLQQYLVLGQDAEESGFKFPNNKLRVSMGDEHYLFFSRCFISQDIMILREYEKKRTWNVRNKKVTRMRI